MASGLLWILVGGVAALATAGAILWMVLRRPEVRDHPSTLSSDSRTVLRPLTQAYESLKSAVEHNKGSEAAQVVGADALKAAENLLRGARQLARSRDHLVEVARRTESSGMDASNVHSSIDQIDTKLHDGTLAIDAMTTRISQAQIRVPGEPEHQDEVSELIDRLQNMGRSYDEVYESAEESTRT